LNRDPDGNLIGRNLGDVVPLEARASKRVGKRTPHTSIGNPAGRDGSGPKRHFIGKSRM
jgi:hypothetical protein